MKPPVAQCGQDCDVLIVGGGPVGLFLACELGAYGVATELYEQAPSTSVHPKANTHAARSLEFYRRHGIAAALRRAGWPGARPTDVVYCTRLLGHELGRVELPAPDDALAAAARGDERWPTAEPQLRTSQLRLEPLLRARATSLPSIRLAFASTVTSIVDHGDGVGVTVVDAAGIPRERRARYVVACDGARSPARHALGLAFVGERGLALDFMGGLMVTTFFRAPTLLDLVGGRPAWQFWVINPERRSLVVSLDGADLFVLHHQLRAGETEAGFDFAAALAAVVGRAVPHEVLSSAPWRAGRALVADHYGRGNVALAGDAAHLFTPTGGLGVNTGIEDVANLAWKLAGSLAGWAGPGLLASYERERRPIAVRNTRFALSLAQAVSACPMHPEMEAASSAGEAARRAAARHIDAVARNEFDHPGLQLGSRYEAGGIVFPVDVAVADEAPRIAYEPSMAPGGRVPHVWLGPGESLLDRCGHRFTLVDFTGADGDAHALAASATARQIPFASVVLDRPDVIARFGAARVLVRPDQIVAWAEPPLRTTTGLDPAAIWDRVTGHQAPGQGSFECDARADARGTGT